MDTSLLLLGVLFSSIGLGYFMYGRRQHAALPMACGLALMLVPYFLSSVALLLCIGLLLSAMPWVLRR